MGRKFPRHWHSTKIILFCNSVGQFTDLELRNNLLRYQIPKFWCHCPRVSYWRSIIGLPIAARIKGNIPGRKIIWSPTSNRGSYVHIVCMSTVALQKFTSRLSTFTCQPVFGDQSDYLLHVERKKFNMFDFDEESTVYILHVAMLQTLASKAGFRLEVERSWPIHDLEISTCRQFQWHVELGM